MSICSAMYTDHAFLQHLQTPLSPNWSGICDLLLATDDLLNCAHTASRKSMRWLWTKEKKGWSQNQHMKVLCFFVDDCGVRYHRHISFRPIDEEINLTQTACQQKQKSSTRQIRRAWGKTAQIWDGGKNRVTGAPVTLEQTIAFPYTSRGVD